MKKIQFFLIAMFISLSSLIIAQNDPCGFDNLNSQSNQAYLNATSVMNQAYLDWMENAPHSGGYDIPVVFHIMHNNGDENITDDQILQALQQANDQFKGLEGGFDTGISLKLASLDPYGNCTSGINRVQTPNPYGSTFFFGDANMKDLSRWDPKKYLNVWIVKGIGFNVAGYAYLPSVAPVNPQVDGVVIAHEYLGNTGTASGNQLNTLAHEVGHYLGLYHVWGDDQDDCDDNCHDYNQTNGVDNCLTHGDWVCDTNPAYEADFTSDCSDDLSTCQSCPIDLMLPYPKDNYMSYAHSCQDKFTNGQAERMWFTLEEYRSELWSSENLLCTGVGEHYGHNVTITGNEIWTTSNLPNNGQIIITGTLTIESGGKLTIDDSNVKINFCEYGRIVVKQGGMFINEGTLTNACQAPWKGIEVWGTTGAIQGNYFSHPDHGVLILRSGAVVENAEIGVKLYGPDYLNDAGGMISCHNASFINNGTAVHFAPYDLGGDYSAYFSRCSFESDGSFLPFSSFLDMNNVKGIRISSSSFTYTGGPSFGQGVEQYRYGIWAKNSGFKLKSRVEYDKFGNATGVGRCTFYGLGYGVWISNLLGNKYYEVEQAIFENCYTGIYNNGMSLGKILFNDFNLGTVPDASLIGNTYEESQIGVHLENPINGITFQQNEFSSTSTSFNTTGTIIEKIGDYNNYIRKNDYTSNTFGNIATGNNGTNYPWSTGIRYFCNELSNTTQYDFAIPNTPEYDKINKNQGVFDFTLTQQNGNDPVYRSAGNKFSYNEFQYGDFYNEQGAQTIYWYEDGAPNEEPLDYFQIQPELTEEVGDCDTELCEPPCPIIIQVPDKEIVKGHFIIVKDDYNEFVNTHFGTLGIPSNPYNPFTDNGEIIDVYPSEYINAVGSGYQEVMDGYIQQALQIIASDSTQIDFEDYTWWISQIGSYEGDIWLAQEFAASGNWNIANSVLSTLPSKYNLTGEAQQDYNNIVTIFSILQSENSTAYEPQLTSIAQLDYGYAPVWANSVLNTIGSNLPVKYYLPTARVEKRALNKQDTKNISNIKIYPNPSSGEVNLQIEGMKERNTEVLVMDLSGKICFSGQVEENEILDLSSVNHGVYIIQVVSNGEVILSDRLIIIK